MKLSQKANNKFDKKKKRFLPYVKGRNKVNSTQKETNDVIQEIEPQRITKMLVFSGQQAHNLSSTVTLASQRHRASCSPFSAGQQIMQTACQGALTTQAMPHVGASQSAELAEVHTKMFLIHLVYGSM